MTVKLEHAGQTVELKADVLNGEFPQINILINGKMIGFVCQNGHFHLSILAKITVG